MNLLSPLLIIKVKVRLHVLYKHFLIHHNLWYFVYTIIKQYLFIIISGNKYIVVYTEYLTKWVDAEVKPSKNAATIINSLVKFVCTHGIPDTLITDQGREFCNELNKLFCEKMGICHKVASPYHPQTGGQTERFNRTLSNMLVSFVNKTCDDWDLKLPYVLFAYRTAEHSTTRKRTIFSGIW